MGNCYSSRQKQPHPVTFDKNEMAVLEDTFAKECEKYPESRRHQAFSVRNFEELFAENPAFGRKLFIFMEHYQEEEKYIRMEPLLEFLEVILKEQFVTQNPQLKYYDRCELIALISLQSYGFLGDREDLNKLQVTYLQALEVMNDLVQFHQHGRKSQPINETCCKAFIDAVYRDENGVEEWPRFVEIFNQLRGANDFIRHLFEAKFMHKEFNVPIPVIGAPSYLLTEELLFMLYLSNPRSVLCNSNSVQLVFSSLMNKGGLEALSETITSSKVPTLTLIQHEDLFTQLYDRSTFGKPNLFGAISNQRWFNTGLAGGLDSDSIFCAYPQFRVFHAKPERNAGKNFCYLNYCHGDQGKKGKPQGMGFGGTPDGHNCRIWIDQNVEQGSYCNSEDDSYQSGPLVSNYVKQLKISLIEVWGIHHAMREIGMDDDNQSIKQDPEDPVRQEGSSIIEVPENLLGNPDYYWMANDQQSILDQSAITKVDLKQQLDDTHPMMSPQLQSEITQPQEPPKSVEGEQRKPEPQQKGKVRTEVTDPSLERSSAPARSEPNQRRPSYQTFGQMEDEQSLVHKTSRNPHDSEEKRNTEPPQGSKKKKDFLLLLKSEIEKVDRIIVKETQTITTTVKTEQKPKLDSSRNSQKSVDEIIKDFQDRRNAKTEQ